MQFVHNEDTRAMLEALKQVGGVYHSLNSMDAGNEVHGTVLVVTEYNKMDKSVQRQWVSGVLDDEYFSTNTIEFMDGKFVITNKNSGPTMMVAANGGLEAAVEGWNEARLTTPLTWHYHIEIIKL